MEPGAGAILARQIATPTGNGNGDATALGRQLLAGQRNARVGHIEDCPDVFIVKPLRHQCRSDVDLVLVIPEQDTNLLAKTRRTDGSFKFPGCRPDSASV